MDAGLRLLRFSQVGDLPAYLGRLGAVIGNRGGPNCVHGRPRTPPSLLMVSRELAAVINPGCATETAGRTYLDHLNTLTRTEGRVTVRLRPGGRGAAP